MSEIAIEFLGAARTVTGSMHLLHTPHARVLLECGLFQGRRRESIERNRTLPFRARDVDVCVLSHAHIDHSGALPLLQKHGFQGRVYATPATRDLCAAMLEDAAMIQVQDARYLKRMQDRGEGDPDADIEPLYEERHVRGILRRMVSVPYHLATPIAPGVQVTFLDAGHVLGSAIVVVDVEGPPRKRIVFTGDLGRRRMPILRDPEIPEGADVILSESTYGDRLHPPLERMEEELAGVLKRTYERGGKVIIPSFALERAQEVIYALKHLHGRGQLPDVPVYVDSPLTVRVTDIFKLHPDCYDDETRQIFEAGDSPFDLPNLHYVSTVAGSKAITESDEPCIVISASGMCENGRILHHLRSSIGGRENTVLIVGYQAQHTLGRRLVEQRTRVRIFGVERERRCEVVVLNGFSAHGDQSDLLDFAVRAHERGDVKHIALVHGDPKPQDVLAEKMKEAGCAPVMCPERGDTLTL